jgi:hypothetical protein
MTVDIKRSKSDLEIFVLKLERKRKKGDTLEEETCESKLVVGSGWRSFPSGLNNSVIFVNTTSGIVAKLEDDERIENGLRLSMCSLHNSADKMCDSDGTLICKFDTLRDATNALKEIVCIPAMFITV